MNRLSLCLITLLCAAPYEVVFGQQPLCELTPVPAFYKTDAILKALVNPPHDADHPSRRLVLVVAHRGDWQHYPENSMAAITSAAQEGIELIEIDVRLSLDRLPFLLHDYNLDRLTTGTGSIGARLASDLNQLFLRDRYGTPTREYLLSFPEFLSRYYSELTCVNGAGEMRGSVLIVDVKGGGGSGTTYSNLKPVWLATSLVAGVTPGKGLVFKVKAKDLPSDARILEQDLGWSATVRNPARNLLLVLNPDDPTITNSPDLDTKLTEYIRKPYVLGFELNQSYKGDRLEPYIKYLQSKAAPPQLGGKSPRTIMMYLQDNFLPEGVAKSDATCCYLANTDRSAITPEHPLDYRGRIELFGGRADLLTVDRLSDVLNYLEATGRRDTTLLE